MYEKQMAEKNLIQENQYKAHQRWVEAHPNYWKEYRQKNKEKLNKYSEEWCAKNTDRIKETERVRYQRNKEKYYKESRTPLGRFKLAQQHAKVRKHCWNLTLELFISLLNKPCFYCENPSTVHTGSGLDRVDSSGGYTPDNVVPCCYRCNVMKNRYLTCEEMLLIWKLRREKQNA